MKPGDFWRRLVHLVRGTTAADELREEMQLHAELRARANRSAGMSDEDARALANRQFGNQIVMRGKARDQWGVSWLEDSARDIRFGVRRLAQRPGFTMAVISVLALGIGATTAMFSAVDAAMLRPLPFADPSKLVTLHSIEVPFDPGPGQPHSDAVRFVSVLDVQAMSSTFSHAAVYAAGGMNLSDGDHPLRLKVGVVSGDFFATLGVAPLNGRAIDSTDAVSNGSGVAMLSFGLWQRQFGGSAMLGNSISLNNKSYQIIGVMPNGFGFPSESDVWIPMSIPNTFATFSAFRGYLPTSVIARVAPSATLESAEARLMAAWTQRAALEAPQPGPAEYKWVGKTLVELKSKRALAPLQRELTGDRRTALLVLLGATLLLLLVTCANVTNLLLSQVAVRRHEIAVRAVLGASRGRIVRQLLTESIVLAVTGTAAGLILAPAMLGTMRALLPVQLGGVAAATLDLRVLTFAAALALVTGIAFGLWPAFGTSRSAPAETIKSGGRSSTGRGASRARRMLLTTEIALTIVLLVASLLMLRSFDRLMSLDRGMHTERVGTAEMAFTSATPGRTVTLRKIDDILARLEAMPGVTGAGAINDLPLGPVGGIAVQIKPDVAPPAGTKEVYPRYLMASGGYFSVMGIPVTRGRTFTPADDSLAPPVAVISESMAKAYWPGVDAIGRTFTLMSPKPITVVGIVADVRERRLESDGSAQMYFPIAEQTPGNAAIVARGTMDSDALLARIKEAVHAVDPSQAIYNLRMMDEVVAKSVAPRRANTVLISAFAALALLLSSVGIYAVVSYNVTQRTREFGIRSALGATGGELVRLVTGEMGWVALIGIVSGVGGAWAFSKVLASLIYGVTIHDPWSFAAAPLLLLVPAIVAAVVPARRATQVNPAEVMRAD